MSLRILHAQHAFETSLIIYKAVILYLFILTGINDD